jgi:hypothetical protein
MLEGVVAPRPAIWDLAELVQQAVLEAEQRSEANHRQPAAQEAE